jgi:uncharacterized protein involved in exopolysaccharide biosynthesis
MFNQRHSPSTELALPVQRRLERAPVEIIPDSEPPVISASQVIAIVRAHWKVSAAIFAFFLLATVAITVLTPKTYSATATLIVNFNSLDPLAAKELAEGGQNSYIPTQIDLMQSDEVLDSVIEHLALTKVPEFTVGSRSDAASLRDWVGARLRKNLDVEQGRGGSQLIYVGASATNAVLAADIANSVAASYLERSQAGAAGPSNERANRYSQELGTLKGKVDDAQSAFSKFRAQSGGVDIDSKGEVDIDVLSALEHRLLDARNALRSSQAKATGKQELTTSMLNSTSVGNLREEGEKLASQMAQLRAEFGPKHPDVIALQSKIDTNKASQASTMSAFSNANSSDMSVTSHEVASLERAVAEQRGKVLRGKMYRDQAAQYQLELESAQNVYKRALDGYDQTRFAASNQNLHVSLASRARPAVRADKPNPLKYLMIGTALGLLLALVVPFALELPKRRIRVRDDIEREFEIPVLAEFSAIPASSTSAYR